MTAPEPKCCEYGPYHEVYHTDSLTGETRRVIVAHPAFVPPPSPSVEESPMTVPEPKCCEYGPYHEVYHTDSLTGETRRVIVACPALVPPPSPSEEKERK